jgi:hypothetical protein
MNGCVWGQKEGVKLSKKHRGIDLKEFKESQRVNIEKQIPLTTTKIPTFLSLHEMKTTAAIIQVFTYMCKAAGFGSEVLNKVAETWLKESNEQSAFGVQDAFTRAGQLFDRDTWESCDELAGTLVNGGSDYWYEINLHASVIKDEQIQKAFGNTLETVEE